MKNCFLFGQEDAPESILPKLEAALERYRRQLGVTRFYVGEDGDFDRMAAAAVIRLRERYGDVELYLVTSVHPSERSGPPAPGFDGLLYPPLENVPRRYAQERANCYMVDTCHVILCYAPEKAGKEQNLLAYAVHRGWREPIWIENLAFP